MLENVSIKKKEIEVLYIRNLPFPTLLNETLQEKNKETLVNVFIKKKTKNSKFRKETYRFQSPMH